MAKEDGQLEAHAEALVSELWTRRREFWRETPESMFGMLPIPLQKIAVGICGLKYEFVDEIPGEVGGARTAGLWDPVTRTISVSLAFAPDVRQFTGAHELGHAREHPSMISLHRDRGLDGGERSTKRDPMERQADRFAAGLTMPSELLDEVVMALYGDWLERKRSIEDLVYSLRAPGGGRIDTNAFLSADRRQRARWIAKNTGYDGRIISSLKGIFGVSVEAMAIRLEERNLVP